MYLQQRLERVTALREELAKCTSALNTADDARNSLQAANTDRHVAMEAVAKAQDSLKQCLQQAASCMSYSERLNQCLELQLTQQQRLADLRQELRQCTKTA